MARPLRIQYSGATYHVMNRGNAAQKIFRSQEDYRIFLKLLQETIDQWEIRIHAFSLMPNHYHLLLETPSGNLSRAMRHINGVYTQRYNKHWKTDGHLFRGRYKAILVKEDAYLVELLRYIHLNPVHAGIVKMPQDHKWTSHSNYLGKSDLEWLTTERLLLYFGKRRNLARRKLHEFVKEGVPDKLQRQLESNKWPTVLSSDNFREWVEWNFVKDIDDDELAYNTVESAKIEKRKLERLICSALEMKWDDLCNASGKEAKMKRGLAIRSFRRHLKYNLSELSDIFGGIHVTNVSRAANRELKEDDTASQLWERLKLEIQNAKRKT